MSAPCSKCHKRHGRSHDHGPSGVPKPPARPNRAFVLMASLLVGTAAASSSLDRASPLTGVVGIRGRDNTRITGSALSIIDKAEVAAVRRIQEEHDGHDDGDEDEEHHDEEGSEVNVFVDSSEIVHEDHDGDV